MKSETILKQLGPYLSSHDVERLRLNLVLKGSIVMCYAIYDITKNIRCSQEDENIISELLSRLCHNHFKTIDSKNT